MILINNFHVFVSLVFTAVIAMVSTVYDSSSTCPTDPEGSAAGGGACVLTSERAGPQRGLAHSERRHALLQLAR